MKTLTYKNITVDVPECWNELTASQAMMVYSAMYNFSEALEGSIQERNLRRWTVFSVITGIDDNTIKELISQMKDAGEEDDVEDVVEQLISLADPFFDITTDRKSKEKIYSPKLALTRAPYPELGVRSDLTLYACKDGLSNCRMGEVCAIFSMSEILLEQFDENILDRLIATIYRPAKEATPENIARKYDDDIRQEWVEHEHLAEDRIPLVSWLPHQIKQIIWFWCLCCRESWINEHRVLFDYKANIKKNKSGNDYGWAGLVMSLAGSAVNIRKIEQMNGEDAFLYLVYLYDQAERQKPAAKDNRK